MRLIPRGSRREGWYVALIGTLLYFFLRLIGATMRRRFVDADNLLARFARGEPVILAFWHGRMVAMPFAYSGRGACIMNSRHRDGALITRAIEGLGIEVVRGSSTRGWVGGLRGLLAAHRSGRDLVVVPDGPRGPRCRAKTGVLQLARATGAPIFPVSNSARPAIVARRSWDWLSVPLPGARVVYVVEEPVWVPPDADGPELEDLRALLEIRLNRATRRADETLGVASSVTDEYTGAGPFACEHSEKAA